MIIALAAYPKSGNTWLRLGFRAYREGDAFDPAAKTPPDFPQDNELGYYKAVSPTGTLEALTRGDLLLLRPAALLAMALRHGTAYVKTHAVNAIYEDVRLIPRTLCRKAVYIVRDPRDVAVSLAHHLGVDIDEAIDDMASPSNLFYTRGRVTPTSTWSFNVGSWTNHDPDSVCDVLTLRYEDMLADPMAAFRNAVLHIGWELDEERLAAAIEATTFDRLSARERDAGFPGRSRHQEKFFRQGKAGAWQDVLTPEQAARIERDHGAVMVKHGYHVPLREVA